MAILLIVFSCLFCVSAEDLKQADLAMDEEHDLQVADSNETLSQGDDNASSPNDDVNISTDDSSASDDSKAYLILDNDADKETVYVGDYVTWIVGVINNGPDTAKNVNVLDQLPDGLKYISHIATQGTFNPKTGIWNIGDLTVSAGEVFLNITTKATSVGEKINKANLTSDTYNLNANESYEEEEIDVFEHEAKAFSLKSVDSNKNTGNPIALIVLSLFAIIIANKQK